MGLREIAQADLGVILSDKDTGFGWDISLTNPAGNTESFVGFSNDVGQLIDPETGTPVSGRAASIAISMASLTEVGFDFPVAIADSASKPWIVQFDDIGGNECKFKVAQSFPDRTLGIVTCRLELYR